MSHEVTIPLLPCASLDAVVAFYEVLGFRTTYRQRRPNPYAALRREDLHLHFFEIDGFDPHQSYGSCVVLTSDPGELHRAFAAGMRAAYGKVLVAGLPRMTRPRPRKNADGVSGFSVIDPGGNWVRVFQHAAPDPQADGPAPSQPAATGAGIGPAATGVAAADPETGAGIGPAATGPGGGPTATGVAAADAEQAAAPAGRLAKALADAIVLADSKGDTRQAARILDSVLARPQPDDDPVAQVEVLVYRAELAMVLDDPATAADLLARAHRVALSPDAAARAASAFEAAADLAAAMP